MNEDSGAALIYDPAYLRYRFNDEHPFNPLRLELAVDLMEACGLLAPAGGSPPLPRSPALPLPFPPRPATRDELLLAHDLAYIEAVERLSAPGAVCADPIWGSARPTCRSSPACTRRRRSASAGRYGQPSW